MLASAPNLETPVREDLKYDKRLIDRHLKLGLLKADELNSHMGGLPDVLERGAPLKVEVADAGVSDVQRKDDGETDD